METLGYRQPRIVAVALLVILAAGLSALVSLGRQEDPTITNIFATVTTVFPGADPGRVEALVTAKIEEELKAIPEILEVKSTSLTGVSVVAIDLVETTPKAEIELVWSDIRDALADARREFPEGVLEPEFSSDAAGGYAAIFAVTARAEGVGLARAAREAEALADALRAVSGTRLVEIHGLPQEEVLVEVDPAAAAALGLTADQISAAIAAADSKVRAGRLRAGGSDLVIAVEGEITALDRLRGIVLREGEGGASVLLGDLARITRGPQEPLAEAALFDGRAAILVSARLSEGLQVDGWMGDLQARVAAFRTELPQSLSIDQIFDQSRYTTERLQGVAWNMAQGMALVVLVLLVTLGWRPALLVALALPIVTLASFASMAFLKLPIHQMSVTGLIVALGLVVDCAIVVTDEVGQRLRQGVSRLAAVGGTVRRLFLPLLASTVTTVLAFLPLLLLPGPAGDFVGSIAIAVVLMLCWSFALAVFVTPALAGWFLRAEGPQEARAPGPLGRAFRASLDWSMANPLRSVMLALVLPVTGFAALPTLQAQFFPGADRDQFHIEIELPEGTALERTREAALGIDAVLHAEPEIGAVAWVIGRSAPAFYYNLIGNRDQAPNFAQALVTTASPQATARLLGPLQARLDADFPEARVLVRGLVQGPPVDAPVEMRLVGPDTAVLRGLGAELRAILGAQEGVTVTRASVAGGGPRVSLAVDEAQARLVGLDLGQIARQLEAALEGVTGGSLIEGAEELPVRVRMGAGLRGDLRAIADMPILPPGAAPSAAADGFPALPLSALAELDIVPAEGVVTRRNGERVNTVQAYLAPGVLPDEALRSAQAALEPAGFRLPPGYRLEYGGDSDARATTLNALFAPLGLIVTLTIATVVVTFNSFRLAAIAFAVAGLSAGLSLLPLAVFGYPFGINAIIGVIGSIGVSINAAIIVLSGLQEDAGAMAGDRRAMAGVVERSSRHIVSTTVTTFGGFLPLVIAGGGFWPPFAMAIAGGVLLSTVLAFWFTPQMFALTLPRPRPAQHSAALAQLRAGRPAPLAAE